MRTGAGLAGLALANYTRFPTRQYLLFVGTIEPRKNLGVLLDDYTSLRSRIRPGPAHRGGGRICPPFPR